MVIGRRSVRSEETWKLEERVEWAKPWVEHIL